MPKIVPGELFGLFGNPICCKISKKMKGDPLETLKNFQKTVTNCFPCISSLFSLMGVVTSISFLCSDIDGMGNLELGGMMLHTSTKVNASLKRRIQHEQNPSLNAGLKFARRILLAVWDTILDVLAQPLRSKTLSGVTSIAMLIVEGTKEITQRDREAICLSLEGLRSAAQLSCALGMTHYSIVSTK